MVQLRSKLHASTSANASESESLLVWSALTCVAKMLRALLVHDIITAGREVCLWRVSIWSIIYFLLIFLIHFY